MSSIKITLRYLRNIPLGQLRIIRQSTLKYYPNIPLEKLIKRT